MLYNSCKGENMLYRFFASVEDNNKNNVSIEKNIGLLSNTELLSKNEFNKLILFCNKFNIKYRLEYNMFASSDENVLSVEECINKIKQSFKDKINFNKNSLQNDEISL